MAPRSEIGARGPGPKLPKKYAWAVVGAPCLYTPIIGGAQRFAGVVTSEPFVMGGGRIVVDLGEMEDAYENWRRNGSGEKTRTYRTVRAAYLGALHQREAPPVAGMLCMCGECEHKMPDVPLATIVKGTVSMCEACAGAPYTWRSGRNGADLDDVDVTCAKRIRPDGSEKLAKLDTDGTDMPICPHCGHVEKDPWELPFKGCDGDIEASCDACGLDYFLTRDCKFTYSSKIVEACGEGGA